MSINNLNDVDLINLAKSAIKKKKRNIKSSSVDKFIRKLQVTRGVNKIPTYLIYYIYKTDESENGAKKVGKSHFFRHFNSEFQQVRHGLQRYYMIDWNITITDELLQRAKKYDSRYQNAATRRSV